MACFLEWEAGCGLLLTSSMVLLLVQGRITCRANFVSDIHLNYLLLGRGSVSFDVTTLVILNKRRHVCGLRMYIGLKFIQNARANR